MLSENVAVMGCLVLLQLMTSAMTQQQQYPPQKEKVRMCYYTNWSQYRFGVGKFMPENIDPFLCTHILYAFGRVDAENHTVSLDDPNDAQLYEKIIDLKEKNPYLKVLLAVGGGSHGTTAFEELGSSEQRAQKFADKLIPFLRQNGFDGLDVDWEFPTEKTRAQFQLFIKHVAIRFIVDGVASGLEKMELTVAVSGDPASVDTRYGPEEIVQFVDYVLLMAYDLWGTWSRTLGHHSPLHVLLPDHLEQGRFSMSRLVNEWTKHGVPKSKLVLGLSTYGHTGVMSSAADHHPGDQWARHMGTAGPITRLIGFLSYFEMCNNLKSEEWNSAYSITGQVPYAWNPTTLQYCCYDDPRSFEAKARYILDEDLEGAMFWALDYDDFTGASCNNGTYPLLRRMKTILTGREDNGDGFTTSAQAAPSAAKNDIEQSQTPPAEHSIHPPTQSTSPTTIPEKPINVESSKASDSREDNNSEEPRLRPLPAHSGMAPTSGWLICVCVVSIFSLFVLISRFCCSPVGETNLPKGKTKKQV